MINRKIKILSVTTAAILAVVMARSVNAYWDGGNEDSGGGGGSCTDYNMGANWCKRFKSWYYYEYAPGIDYGDVKVEADGGGFSYGTFSRATSITVGGNCDNYSSGFYVSGIILWDDTKGTTTSSADDVMYGGSSWSGHWIGVAKYDPDNSTYLTLRKSISWYPVDNTPAKNKIQSVTTVPASEVEGAWNSYGRDYKLASLPADATEEQRETAGKLTEWSWFCAGDKAKQQEQYYTGESFIRLTDKADANLTSNTNELASCKSNGSASNTCSKKITDGSGTKRIYYMAAGLVSKDSTKTLTKDYEEFEGTKFDLYNATANNSATAISGTEKDGIEGTIRDVSYHYNYDYGTNYHAAYIDMNPGDKKTICAVNNYHTHYIDGAYEDSKNKVSACIELEYVPYVAAIDSTTALTLNGVRVGDSGADTTKDFNYGEENYGYEVIAAKWDYLLYSTGRCVENNFHTTYCNPTISTAESFNVGYKRSGKLYTDTDTQKANLKSTEYKYSPGSTTKKYSLLPGETIKAEDTRQGIKHRSGVRTNGDNATGSKDEESSAGFTATAKNAVCNINGLEFGLNNPVNYGRMTVYKGGTPRYYGNGKNSEGAAVWNTNGPLYFRPDEELKIGYDACLGQQIKADKDSGKPWDAEWTTGNAKLTVGITGSLLDSSHFTSTGNAVSTDSADSRNILAYEVLGKKISSHVGKDYQFYNVNSEPAQIGNLGHSIVSDFGDLSGCPEGGSNCKAHAVLNVPYNYILTPSINDFTESIVTIGNSFKFKTSINKSGRINEDVQSTAYPTDIKKTWAKYLTFKLSTDVDYNKLNTAANNIATLDNNQTDNLGGILRARLGGSSIIDMGSGEFTDDEIKKGTQKEIPVNATDADAGYNKLCVAVAVYPADSHNSRDDTIHAGADQSNALTDGPGANAFTRISVKCRTVGKYPTFSTEGNGILSGGNVSGKYTRYNDERDFGSWSEYGLIANEVDKVASGASIAYIEAQSGINAGVSHDRAGKEKNQLDSPQTLGNMDKNEIGLRDSTEASVYANQMTEIANNIKSTFFTDPMPAGGPFLVEYPGTHTWVNLNYKDDVWIGGAEADAINNHRLAGDQVIIYSDKNIMIENTVMNLDAMLVANGKVDTCYIVDDSGNKMDVDQGGDNSQLLNHCHDNLTVNGAVYSKEAIELDRTYGGGSETDLNLREDTLVQRAEIFNFDPRTVKWGYDYDNGNQPLITTYIEELSTRY